MNKLIASTLVAVALTAGPTVTLADGCSGYNADNFEAVFTASL